MNEFMHNPSLITRFKILLFGDVRVERINGAMVDVGRLNGKCYYMGK